MRFKTLSTEIRLIYTQGERWVLNSKGGPWPMMPSGTGWRKKREGRRSACELCSSLGGGAGEIFIFLFIVLRIFQMFDDEQIWHSVYHWGRDIVCLLVSEEENRAGSLLPSEGPWAGAIWCYPERAHPVPCESSQPKTCYLIS